MVDEAKTGEAQSAEDVKTEVERIVEEGQEVRRRVGRVVASASDTAAKQATGLAGLVEKAVQGAVEAVDRSAPEDPESTLRQVIEGVGDGLERTAQATKLAVEEAAGEGRSYASEDLNRVSEDLGTLSRMFVETVERGVQGVSKEGRVQVQNVREHASRTLDAIKPSLEQAADAAVKDPIGLAGESAAAAVNLTREAAGSLFSAMGKLLQGAGDRVAPTREEEEKKGE